MSCLVLTLGDVPGGLMLQLGKWLGSRLLKIPDLDSSVSTSSQPLIGWVEFEIVDLRLGLECDGWLLEVIDIPYEDGLVFSAGGDVLSGWCDGQGVDSSIMSFEGELNLEVLVPDLKESVPAYSSEVFQLLRGRVPNPTNPVIVNVLVNRVLALTFHVPELDVLLASTRQDNPVVGVKAAGEDLLGVTVEDVLCLAQSQIPESHRVVP